MLIVASCQLVCGLTLLGIYEVSRGKAAARAWTLLPAHQGCSEPPKHLQSRTGQLTLFARHASCAQGYKSYYYNKVRVNTGPKQAQHWAQNSVSGAPGSSL